MILSYTVIILALIVLLPIIILSCLILLLYQILYTPIGYYKFKNSLYQKDFPCKFKWLDTPHKDNKVYTIIKENDLPIEYIKFYEDYDMPGYFLYKDVLLDFSEPFFFDKKKGLWLFWQESQALFGQDDDEPLEPDEEDNTDDCLTVEEAKELCIEEFKRNIPARICNHVVFFYCAKKAKDYYGEDALNTMQNSDKFILYEKEDLEKVIKEYIANN